MDDRDERFTLIGGRLLYWGSTGAQGLNCIAIGLAIAMGAWWKALLCAGCFVLATAVKVSSGDDVRWAEARLGVPALNPWGRVRRWCHIALWGWSS